MWHMWTIEPLLACEYLPLCSRLEHLRREEAVVGIGYPDWCFRHCFRENIGLCCGVEQGSFNSIYHLISGVWNTIVFLVQLGIAICCQWERFNPLTDDSYRYRIYIYIGFDWFWFRVFLANGWPIHRGLPYHLFIFLGFSAEELHQDRSAKWRQQMPQGLKQRAQREGRMSMWSADSTDGTLLGTLLDGFCCLVGCRILGSSWSLHGSKFFVLKGGDDTLERDPSVLVWRRSNFPARFCWIWFQPVSTDWDFLLGHWYLTGSTVWGNQRGQ